MKQQERNHRIVSPPTFHTSGGAGSPFVVTEHVISLPVVRGGKEEDGQAAAPPLLYKHGRIDVYFSIVEQVTDEEKRFWLQDLVEMTPSQRASTYVTKAGMTTADSMTLYLQGGPGFGSPTPIAGLGMTADASWAGKALSMSKNFERVVLMDQRGTGKSTPITKQTLEMNFPDLFLLDNVDGKEQPTLADLKSSRPQEAAKVSEAVTLVTDYFSHFRADNIVEDAEEIRDALLLPLSLENAQDKKDKDDQPHPWGACLGQSYGGFCLMTYLSQVDHPPKLALFTGGIAPMLTPTDEVYVSLWQRVKERSYCYYEMYPGDVIVVKRIVQRLLQNPAKLPSGGTLTARRFLQLGMSLGGSPSSFASLHALFASAFVTASNIKTDEDHWQFSRAFLKAIDSAQNFDDHPIYYLLHESIYANGPEHSPTNWSAHRQYQDLVEGSPSEFDYRYTSAALENDTKPTLFFGEMVFPWMSQDYAECSGIGLTAVAQALATKTDWGPLWNGPRMAKVLESDRNCRAAAAVYYNDLYVDFDACMKVTARGTGPLEKCKVYITNDYQHSGLRDDGAKIFAKLHGMATGTVRTPS
jgi:pimeloyl-ACP methyl ester carboxylesterase